MPAVGVIAVPIVYVEVVLINPRIQGYHLGLKHKGCPREMNETSIWQKEMMLKGDKPRLQWYHLSCGS